MVVIWVFGLKNFIISSKPRSLFILWKFSAGRSDEDKQIWNKQMRLENLGSNSELTISNGEELAKLNQSCQKCHSELHITKQEKPFWVGLPGHLRHFSPSCYWPLNNHFNGMILLSPQDPLHASYWLTMHHVSMWSHDFSIYILSYLPKISFNWFQCGITISFLKTPCFSPHTALY